MFAYVIIAVELAILYTVFWYVFLREPKPYRLRGNAWGAYDGPEPKQGNNFAFFSGRDGGHEDCNCRAQQDEKIRSASAIYEEWNATTNSVHRVPLTAGELIRSQARGVERVTRDMPVPGTGTTQYAPFNPAEQCRSNTNRKNAESFLAKLGDKLNLVNVKLP